MDLLDLLHVAVISLLVATISWTVTNEEIFRTLREGAQRLRENSHFAPTRYLLYPLSCEYCFSHWVTLAVVVWFRPVLMYSDVRGSILAGFVIVWLANWQMSAYRRLRLSIAVKGAEKNIVQILQAYSDGASKDQKGAMRKKLVTDRFAELLRR